MAKPRKPDDEITKKTKIQRNRDDKIRAMLKENERLLGKNIMDANKKEAQDFFTAVDEEAISTLTSKEVDEMLNEIEDRYFRNRKRYEEKQKLEHEKVLKEHENSPEFIEKYIVAKKMTRSVRTATVIAESNTLEEVKQKYQAFRKAENDKNRKKKSSVKKQKNKKDPKEKGKER